jgi:WD40-like Beta Propeller Repeat
MSRSRAQRPAFRSGQPIETVVLPRRRPADWNDAPNGRYFFPSPVVYTCWQLERSADGSFNKPKALFESHCGHSGYIAGNWAVRRNPRVETILFIEGEKPRGHAVWSFDVKSGKKSRVFPPAGVAAPGYVLCDFSPDGSTIVCTAGRDLGGLTVTVGPHSDFDFDTEEHGASAPRQLDGIWIHSGKGAAWRHVAQTTVGSDPHIPEGLGALIERRPVFSSDGSRFAFVRPAQDPNKPRSLLFRGRTSERKVEQVFKTVGQILDAHWSPDGSQLGFVEVESKHSRLTLIDAQGKTGYPAPRDFVRSFAGWNATGDAMAYVVAEHAPPELPPASQGPTVERRESGSPLLWPDPLARDALVVVPKGGEFSVVISGLRLTFPQWSPAHETISVWGTFTPSHQSWIDGALGRGLTMRAGDPAAVIDVKTKMIRWLAINGDEEAQIGHYLQLKRDFAGALERYRKAEKTLPKLEPLTPNEIVQGASGAASRRRIFEFLLSRCLTKLHEDREAAEHLHAFEQAYQIRWPSPAERNARSDAPAKVENASAPANASVLPLFGPEARPEAEQLASVIRAFAEAQAILSLDDLDGAVVFFDQKRDATRNKEKPNSLSSAAAADEFADLLALSQIDLLAGRNAHYLQIATNEIGRLLATSLDDPRVTSSMDATDTARLALAGFAGRALSPLFDPGFVNQLPADTVAQATAQWQALRPKCRSQSAALIVDYVSRGLLPTGKDRERDELTVRIAKNPARQWFSWGGRPPQ